MAYAIGFNAYRIEVVAHPVPVRVIGPDSRQRLQLSRACSWIWINLNDKAKARRWIGAFLWHLNVVHAWMLENGAAKFDVGDLYVSSNDGCRQVQDDLIVAKTITSEDAKENDGSYWIKPKKRLYGLIADALIANGMITCALTIAKVFDQDPTKVDHAVSRTGGKGYELKQTRRGLRADTDRRIRLSGTADHAPRFDDPRFYARLKVGLMKTGALQCFQRACGLGYHGGGRAMSVIGLTIFDVLVSSKKPGHYPSRNKGDDDGERSFKMIVPRSEHQYLFDYIGGERARLSGYSLEKLRLLAKDPKNYKLLRQMPVLTKNGVDHLTYHQLWRAVRKAAVAMDLFIDDEEDAEAGRKRFVTFHYLRHEYVHRRMDKIRELPAGAKRESAKDDLVAYMRWTSREMLKWYSAHHELKHGDIAAEAFNDNEEGAAYDADAIAPAPNDADFDEMEEAFA